MGGGDELFVGDEAITKFAVANLASGVKDGNDCNLGTVLIDAQGFVDGIGPMPTVPFRAAEPCRHQGPEIVPAAQLR